MKGEGARGKGNTMIFKAAKKRRIFIFLLSFILASTMMLPAGAFADPVGEVPDSIGAGAPGAEQGAENPTGNTDGAGGQSSDEGDPGGGIPGEGDPDEGDPGGGGTDEGDPGGGGSEEGGAIGGSDEGDPDGDGTSSDPDEGDSDEDGNTEESSDEGVDGEEPDEGDQSEGIPLFPLADWVTYSTTSTPSNNRWSNNYPTRATAVTSTLTLLSSGYLERVEWISNHLIVEEYTQSYAFVSSKEILADNFIPSDLAAGQSVIWGGFFSGASFNYVVTGQENPSEDDNLTVIRVSQYTKDWEYVSNYELKGANTTIPFRSGAVRMTELGGNLYIRTCHVMYTNLNDGLNHQSNLTLVLDQATMAFVDGHWGVLNISQSPYGYVSHSFNQFIGTLNGKVYGVDHGDAYERAVSLKSLNTIGVSSYTLLYPFTGTIGANETYASVGGFETSSAQNTLLVVGNSADQTILYNFPPAGQHERNVWLTVTSASNLATTNTIPITSYADTGDTWASTPQLVKINEDKFLIIWGVGTSDRTSSSTAPSRSLGNTINYVFVDGNGNLLGDPVYSAAAVLSDCKPIVVDGSVVWYATGNSNNGTTAPVFYSIDTTTGSGTLYIAPSIFTTFLAGAAIGSSYSEALTANGTEPITWSISDGSLPVGLELSPEGVISGTPTAIGTSVFTVCATNSLGSVTRPLSITVTAVPVAPTITTTSLMGGTLWVSYRQTLEATGTGPITWSIDSGTLPDGLSLTTAGVISGTPTTAGTTTFTIKATNGVSSTTRSISINVVGGSVYANFTIGSFPVATVGIPYSRTLTANGTSPITWSLFSGSLPDGLSISSDGVISGIPTTTGTFSFALRAQNDAGWTTSGNDAYRITVVAAPVAPTITTDSLPGGTVGVAYSQTLSATGDAPITWAVSDGDLPGGLSLAAGVISGTPTAPGTFTFTVKATNGAGDDEAELSITIAPSGTLSITYSTHVQNMGWLAFVPEGEVSGTVGPGLRLEALKVNLVNTTGLQGGISYSAHVQNKGWMAPVIVQNDGVSAAEVKGDLSGTENQALRLEAVRMNVTGDLVGLYDIYYRVHVQSVGWMGWASNGDDAGTAGPGLRLEAIQVCLVPVGGLAPADIYRGISAPAGAPRMIDPVAAIAAGLKYSAIVHVQNMGDITYTNANGSTIVGTVGPGLRMEAMTLDLVDRPETGEIQYETHIQNMGWQLPVQGGTLSGTMGPGLRLEAVRIQLTEDMAAKYDVYYRTHVQDIGWTGWARNGQSCGSANFGYRMEAMQILIVPKGLAPGFNSDYFYQ